MNKRAKEIIQADLYRYGDSIGRIKPLFLRWQIVFRKASSYSSSSLSGLIYRTRLKSLSERSGIQIPTKAKIGPGLRLAHNGSIIINPESVLGKNVNLAPGVTIGKTNRGEKKGAPVIGDMVWIGTNSVIVGNITIGDDVLIAPCAFVNVDVPSHSVVVGNPAVIHHKENATEGYINNVYTGE